MITQNTEIIQGLFFIFIALAGNFISETMGCKLRKHLSNSMLLKHVLLYIIIYITIGYNIDKDAHPIHALKSSAYVYILFMMSMRINIYFTIITLLLIFLLFIAVQYKRHKIHVNPDKAPPPIIENILYINERLILLTIICGFANYFLFQKAQYKNKFSTYTFLTGKHKCNSI